MAVHPSTFTKYDLGLFVGDTNIYTVPKRSMNDVNEFIRTFEAESLPKIADINDKMKAALEAGGKIQIRVTETLPGINRKSTVAIKTWDNPLENGD